MLIVTCGIRQHVLDHGGKLVSTQRDMAEALGTCAAAVNRALDRMTSSGAVRVKACGYAARAAARARRLTAIAERLQELAEIANQVISTFHALPWHMGTADYLQAARALTPQQSLHGVPAEPCWDATLEAAMNDRGKAIPEEAIVASLLADLDLDRGA